MKTLCHGRPTWKVYPPTSVEWSPSLNSPPPHPPGGGGQRHLHILPTTRGIQCQDCVLLLCFVLTSRGLPGALPFGWHSPPGAKGTPSLIAGGGWGTTCLLSHTFQCHPRFDPPTCGIPLALPITLTAKRERLRSACVLLPQQISVF